MTQQPHDLVNHFNHDHTIGTPVRYWTGTREGAGKTSHIRTRAELMGGHTPVVWVEGEASAIALTHIEPITLDPLARARTLAADYQANPTPARAHNAAQVLQQVLNTLDAVVARTFAITDANDRLAAAELVCELFGGRGVEHDQLGKALTQAWIDWHRLSNTRTDRAALQPTVEALAARRDQTRAETIARMATGGTIDTTTARIGEA